MLGCSIVCFQCLNQLADLRFDVLCLLFKGGGKVAVTLHPVSLAAQGIEQRSRPVSAGADLL